MMPPDDAQIIRDLRQASEALSERVASKSGENGVDVLLIGVSGLMNMAASRLEKLTAER